MKNPIGTILTRQDGRKERVIDHITVCGFTSNHVEVIPETNNEQILRVINKATVFDVPAGIGICHCELYLYPDGTIHNGAGDGDWRYSSVDEAKQHLDDFKEKYDIIS